MQTNNPTSSIGYNFYTDLYGPAVATNMSTWKDNGTGGQCYGMAVTNAYFIKHGLKSGLPEPMMEAYINQLTENSYVNFGGYYNLSQFIKYAYLLQYCPQLQNQLGMTENDFNALYATLISYFSGGTPVVINIKKNVPFTGWGHTVLPVGMKETSTGFDIYLADSNDYFYFGESIIHLEGTATNITGWSYITDGQVQITNNDFGASISFSTPVEFLEYFTEHGTLQGNDIDTTDSYVLCKYEGVNSVKVGSTAIDSSVKNGYIENTFVPIYSYGGEDVSPSTGYFWINTKAGNIQFSDVETLNKVTLISGDKSIEFSLTEGDSATVSFDKNICKSLEFDTEKGNEFSYVIKSYTDDGTEKIIKNNRIADNDQVIIIPAEEKENISSVSISDIEIKYKDTAEIKPTITADEGAKYTVEYKSSDPSVATVDKDGNIATLSKGETKITCTATDEYGNTVKDTCTVTVKFQWWQWLIWILLLGFLWY